MDISKEDNSKTLWNPLVMRIFTKFIDVPENTLFGITGDIDNLGTFVALNGRARAENLVDLYNQYIRNYFLRWGSRNSQVVIDMCFVPSGEELFLLGVSKDTVPVKDLFEKVNPEINEIIINNEYLKPAETSISFGCELLQETELIEKIRIMVHQMRNNKTFNTFPLYLQIMEQIRNTLAQELDSQKFRTIINNDKTLVILYRNFTYARLLEYKYSTRKSLLKIKNILNKYLNDEKIELLSNGYGLTDQKLALLQILIKELNDL